MIPFQYEEAATLEAATSALDGDAAMAIAGGTTMLDLMKLNVLTPSKLVHVRGVLSNEVRQQEGNLLVGAACTMSKLADHKLVHERCPAIRQSLILAASPQIRNMATMGGNLLQRTRSTYYRHVDMPVDIEGRAMEGFGKDVDTSLLAVLGNGGRLVGMYPGDFANTLLAFDGKIHLQGRDGRRTVAAREFYQLPKQGQFQYSTSLHPTELIESLEIPLTPSLAHSAYLKIRERSSYAFALASCALGLVLDGTGSAAKITSANVALGGLGSIPWHSPEAEAALVGKPASDATFEAAAEAAVASAQPPAGLEFKVPLAKRTLVRACQILRDQGPLSDQQLWQMQHGRG